MDRFLRHLPFADHQRIGNLFAHDAEAPADFIALLNRECHVVPGVPPLSAVMLRAEQDGGTPRLWRAKREWWLAELIDGRDDVTQPWQRVLRPVARLRDFAGVVLTGMDICAPAKQREAAQRARHNYHTTWHQIGLDMMRAIDASDRDFSGDLRAISYEWPWHVRKQIADHKPLGRTRAERIREEAHLERDLRRGREYRQQTANLLQSHGARE